MAEVLEQKRWGHPRRRWRKRVVQIAGVSALVGLGVVGLNHWQMRQQAWSDWQVSNDKAQDKDYANCIQAAQRIPVQAALYPEAQALLANCRFAHAQELARQEQYGEAIAQILAIPPRHPARSKSMAWVNQWSQQVFQQADRQYQSGNLQGAIARLEALPQDTPLRPALLRLGEQWQGEWQRNERAIAQAQQQIRDARWWDARHTLASLSRHPYWQTQSAQLRARVETGISALDQLRQQPERTPAAQPGKTSKPPAERGLIADTALDGPYRANLARGLDEWSAWTTACKSLGGRVVDQGPEVICSKG
jgi:hypothetical protein